MPERAPHHSPEHTPRHHEAREHAPAHQERAHHLTEIEHHKTAEHLTHARQSIEQHAVSGKEVAPSGSENQAPQGPSHVNRELKSMSLKRTLTRTRKRLSTPEKLISQTIHQPIIEKISEAGSQTVARPSGILGGGIVAFLGSALSYFVAKRYGFEYNYTLLLCLFVGGFFLGMLIELAWHARRRKRRR